MSLLNSLKSVFSGKPAGVEGGRSTDRLCIVDGERMLDGREAGPADRAALLQRLARFVERENIRMNVVFSGRPLREVEHGAEFQGIKVFYAEQLEKLGEQILQLVRSGVVVVTNDAELEKQITDRGGITLRSSTFKKAFEAPSEGGGDPNRRGDRGDFRRGGGRRGPPRRGGDRDRVDRGERDRGERSGGEDRRPQNEGGGSQPEPSTSGETDSGSQSSVKNLIDLVE